jgi:hypothetical protein
MIPATARAIAPMMNAPMSVLFAFAFMPAFS